MITYTLDNGTTVTSEEIASAFISGNAVVIERWKQGIVVKSLALDGKHFDTRDMKCGKWWLEEWTRKPVSLEEAFTIAAGSSIA